MYKYICSLLITLSTTLAFSQTKLIQHRSHSGSDEEFQEAYSTNQIPNSNLGVAPRHYVTTAVLDSLIYINDSCMIMVTSRCISDDDYYYDEKQWKPGRDTLQYHPIFSKCHQLDKVKRTIKYDYNFKTQDKIIFIGYDNKTDIKPIVAPAKKPCHKLDKANIPTNNDLLIAVILAFSTCIAVSYKLV